MTRSSVLAVGAFIVAQIAHASVASAQTAATHEWSHGTILTALAGAGTASSADTRAHSAAASAGKSIAGLASKAPTRGSCRATTTGDSRPSSARS
jgi:hypothetical protein